MLFERGLSWPDHKEEEEPGAPGGGTGGEAKDQGRNSLKTTQQESGWV